MRTREFLKKPFTLVAKFLEIGGIRYRDRSGHAVIETGRQTVLVDEIKDVQHGDGGVKPLRHFRDI